MKEREKKLSFGSINGIIKIKKSAHISQRHQSHSETHSKHQRAKNMILRLCWLSE